MRIDLEGGGEGGAQTEGRRGARARRDVLAVSLRADLLRTLRESPRRVVCALLRNAQ